jgi:hypothetical protein
MSMSNANGTSAAPPKSPRKSLASQLDRFDEMITGLDRALLETISDAVKEAVAAAVAAGVQAAIVELATRPDLMAGLARVSAGPAAAPEPPAPPAAPPVVEPAPGPLGRIGRALGDSWRWAGRQLRAAADFALTPVRAAGRLILAAGRRLAPSVPQQILMMTVAAGAVGGAAGLAGGPAVMAAAVGAAGAAAALAGRVGGWLRRTCAPGCAT